MSSLEEKIAKIIASHDAALYDLQTVTENEQTIFRVLVTKKGGVSIDLCADISTELSPFLDVHPPVSGAYRLEVSSPGIERKLSKPIHFEHAVGEKIKVRVVGEEKLKGELKNADENGIVITTKQGDESFAYDQLGTVKTYFEF
ncbi:MAG TPA: ribosome maturation factor RimP [Epsilonproteobacteria bacterium]|nr:ribosome maturation factor RimP [Campylobacterota bacterium]